ncbi:DNA-directed RNA polymerase subunit E'' [archaeon]|jgi:DNA-directed RNA polymerase subunit E"|nr:DNA-directed RNA polymerase subunit E'' [archaeon]MBT4272765.1 DNA-directed RNA polymerase subunit E'' [archaeon]MBT4461564.1 DNA-directed RNA polymerase subunit E'' [archaeon]MBT4857668.1 DNA-directed RNA polymerase subunit E'' [archaeon]MBT5423244.1 DNA-directed RNA polymerase subunit E'' [archaeon]
MAKDKVCKKCKVFVDGPVCPQCKGNKFSTVYQGKINVLDANKSYVAKQMELKEKGKYVIKVR